MGLVDADSVVHLLGVRSLVFRVAEVVPHIAVVSALDLGGCSLIKGCYTIVCLVLFERQKLVFQEEGNQLSCGSSNLSGAGASDMVLGLDVFLGDDDDFFGMA